MGQRTPLPLGRASNKASAPNESVERLLNAYLDAAPKGKEPTAAYGTPGRDVWADISTDDVRGMIEVKEVAYAVIGMKLYTITADGSETEIGVIPGSDDVQMAGDGTNIVVVSGGEIYVYDGLTTGPVTDPDAPAASSVVWIDGYFLFGELGTQQFFISGLGAPMDYDALDFASAEWKPDIIVTPIVLRRTVYLAGTKTIEAQQNTGGADFPFSRYQDVLIEVGFAGRDSGCVSNDTMFWLASDRTARRLDGLTATVISSAAAAKAFKGWADPSLTVVTAHVWSNHLFVVFRNPDGCWVYDQTTDLWHERASYASPTWGVKHCIDCYDKTLFSGAAGGKIYTLNDETYTEDGDVLPFEMISPYAWAGGLDFSVDELEVVMQTGVGSLTLNPTISLSKTANGEDWSDAQIEHLGKAGERNTRVRFGAQGSDYAMAFRLRITDPVKRAILGIYADIDVEIA